LDELSKIKKKYGPTLAEVLAHKEKIDGERKSLGSLEERISQLEKAASEEYTRALTIARQLSGGEKRRPWSWPLNSKKSYPPWE